MISLIDQIVKKDIYKITDSQKRRKIKYKRGHLISQKKTHLKLNVQNVKIS